MQLRSGIAVTVGRLAAAALIRPLSLGTSISCRCGPKKTPPPKKITLATLWKIIVRSGLDKKVEEEIRYGRHTRHSKNSTWPGGVALRWRTVEAEIFERYTKGRGDWMWGRVKDKEEIRMIPKFLA